MPTALMPNGQTTYVQSKLEVSVSLPDCPTKENIERTIRQELAEDPRQLFVRVQGGGGYGSWCFWIQWGKTPNCRGTAPVVLGEDEHNPDVVIAKIKTELSKMDFKRAQAQ